MDAKLGQVLPAILKDAGDERSRVRAIHDVGSVTHVAYDTTLQHYTAYDALTTGSTVCQGYSLLGVPHAEALVGFETRIGKGSVASGSQSGNLVKVDGRWLHMDGDVGRSRARPSGSGERRVFLEDGCADEPGSCVDEKLSGGELSQIRMVAGNHLRELRVEPIAYDCGNGA